MSALSNTIALPNTIEETGIEQPKKKRGGLRVNFNGGQTNDRPQSIDHLRYVGRRCISREDMAEIVNKAKSQAIGGDDKARNWLTAFLRLNGDIDSKIKELEKLNEQLQSVNVLYKKRIRELESQLGK